MNTQSPDKSLKLKVWELVEAIPHDDEPKRVYDVVDIFLMTLIALNVLAVILETVESIGTEYATYFYWFEVFSVICFTIEYLARVWACTSQKTYSKPFWGRIKFLFTPMAIIDLLSIIPFYLTFLNVDMRFVRSLRLFRLFRLFKLIRYSNSLTLFKNVISHKREELLISVLIMFVLIIITASFIYFAEHEAQPDKFTDIPTSMWWAIVTLTTVGYGDVFPITPLGKVFAGIIAVLGIGMFALPTGILGASFIEEIDKIKSDKKKHKKEKHKEKKYKFCPHCGESIEEK
jgi:voltage-gated potassium channel